MESEVLRIRFPTPRYATNDPMSMALAYPGFTSDPRFTPTAENTWFPP
jgi:hypothetical protein